MKSRGMTEEWGERDDVAPAISLIILDMGTLVRGPGKHRYYQSYINVLVSAFQPPSSEGTACRPRRAKA